ncbi:MAG: cardiolipin synthase, partial [Eudoraea sp.]|nr:cardiolipin synthase [Eudoraea sp.]
MLVFALVALYILIALVLVIGLLIHGVKPSKTLAWLLAIFTIPVGGILLYIMLGRNRRKKRLSRLRKDALQIPSFPNSILQNTSSPKYRKLMTLIESVSDFAPTDKNAVTLLEDGKLTFHN